MRASIRPRNSTTKAASWPLISGSLVGNRLNCFGKLGLLVRVGILSQSTGKCHKSHLHGHGPFRVKRPRGD
jgi:hypothetical protein